MIPTVGFNMRKVSKGGVTIKLWDLGGQVRYSCSVGLFSNVQLMLFVAAFSHSAVGPGRAGARALHQLVFCCRLLPHTVHSTPSELR